MTCFRDRQLARLADSAKKIGAGGVEPPTSRLSVERSIHSELHAAG